MSVIDRARNAAEFIQDKTHEVSFDKLIWMLRQKRDEAALQVPEWEQLRDLASAIKEHTLLRIFTTPISTRRFEKANTRC